jgi:hypothetical protein
MNKLMMAAVHGDGTLVLVGGAVLVASLWVRTGVIGWHFFWFLHFIILISSQCLTIVVTIVAILREYRWLAGTCTLSPNWVLNPSHSQALWCHHLGSNRNKCPHPGE